MSARGAEVPLAPFREAFARTRESIPALAERSGLDDRHLRRLLGAVNTTCRKNGKLYGPYGYKNCTYETATKLADALGLDPFEVGL